MQYSLCFLLPSLAVFFARARHSDSRVKGSCTSQNGCRNSPSAVFALHAVGRWPTVFHALYQISNSITVQSGDNCRSYCIHLGRSGPLQVTLQCPIQRPLWSFPHNFTSPPTKGHGDLDFRNETDMVISKSKRMISVAKDDGNLEMGSCYPIGPVTQISERLDHVC